MLGQASGGFTESSSSLRILHLGIRNTVGVLTDDAFTQSNPPVITTAAAVSDQIDTTVLGVLSGSVAFTRPDEGSNYIGGPATGEAACRPLGIFINTANGNSYENTPGTASGKGPYVSGQGTYANSVFETVTIDATDVGIGTALVYAAGDLLFASQNGYLTNCATEEDGHEVTAGATANTTIAILKMPADAAQDEIVYDQRV
jgi:hypothetical protein